MAKKVRKGTRSGRKAQPKPRQARLPGTEDPAIEAIESAAEEYASIRDRRMDLTEQEAALKSRLLSLMKSNNKTAYHHAGVRVWIETEQETVRVRVETERDR